MYYIKDKEQIVLADEVKQNLINTLEFQPQYKEFPILETKENETIINFKLVTLEEAEQQKAREERERISKLSLTRGDVFRGLLKAKGIAKNDIAKFIEAMPETTPEEIQTKELARIDFEDSLNFFRGIPIVEILGASLGLSSEQLDNFFIKGNSDDEEIKANAWKELLTPDPIPEEVIDDTKTSRT